MLSQQTPGDCPQKTTSIDEQRLLPGKIHHNKTITNKSHFRNIAPKMATAVMAPNMLTSHQTPLPDCQNNPASLMSRKSLVMPTQNYALMQVAGQEGTFSLVALPQVAAQQQRLSIPENLKLPIPRCQPTRKKLFQNKATRHSVPRASCKTLKTKARAKAHLITVATVANAESLSSKIQSDNVVLVDSCLTEIAATRSLFEDNPVNSAPGPRITREATDNDITSVSQLGKMSPDTVISNTLQQDRLLVTTDTEATKDTIMGCEKIDNQMDSASSFNLSSTAFANTVQIIQFPPVGKLPILPITKMKSPLHLKSEESSDIQDLSESFSGSESSNVPSLIGNINASPKEDNQLGPTSLPKMCRLPSCEKLWPTTKGVGENTKLQKVGTGKKRGRKRKTADGTFTMQSKRKIYNFNRTGDNKDKIKVGCQEAKHKNTEVFKKYRSIMPKPVLLVQALPTVNSSAALVQTPNRDYPEPELVWDSSLVDRAFSSTQTEGVPTETGIVCKGLQSVSKPWHKCHLCNRMFQLKHHLEDHMNTHMNRRPYSCRLCRKAYVHSGSLNTHMKLHHSESRLKKLIPCEFCSKVFGHVRVYFGHLKEVHRVFIGTEICTNQQDYSEPLKRSQLVNPKTEEQSTSMESENTSNIEDEFLKTQAGGGEVKLQIKCGRCQFTTLTFSDMKYHLLRDHGEETLGQLKEGVLHSSQGAQEELLKHAALHWKQLNEKRNLVKCNHCEEFCTSAKLAKHMSLFHTDSAGMPLLSQTCPLGNHEQVTEVQAVDLSLQNKDIQFWCDTGLNCVLCKQTFAGKEVLFSHWQSDHNCEDPSALWTIFSSYFKQDK